MRVGHYYAGRDNPFWPTLFDSGVIPEPFDYHDDKRVIEFAIGLTDLVKKPSKTPDMLSRGDFAEGRIVLSQKLEEFAPRVVAFKLSKDGNRVTQTNVLENHTQFTVLPTTGAIHGNDFYFIANSQIDNRNGDKVMDVTKLAAVRIAVVRLP